MKAGSGSFRMDRSGFMSSSLTYTPWVVRLAHGAGGGEAAGSEGLALTDQTGAVFEPVEVLIDDEGAVLFVDGANPPRVALLHDHDLNLFSDFAALDENGNGGRFRWRAHSTLPIGTIDHARVPEHFGFIASPAEARGC